MTEDAISKWRKTMAEVGPDGLTRQQRRVIKMKQNNLAKDPDFYKKHAQKILKALGRDGLKKRGEKCSKTKNAHQTEEQINSNAMRRYRSSVAYFTRKHDLSDLPNWKKPGFQVDHIFSVIDGFKLDVDPRIVAHRQNLQVLTRKENRDKYMRSDQTLEQLMEKIS